MTAERIVWTIIIGAGVAAIYVYYVKKILGGIVRRLLEVDAFDEETAVELSQINAKINIFARFSMREGTTFANTVVRTDDGRYYIPEHRIRKAEKQYKNGELSLPMLIIILFFLLIIGLISEWVVPQVRDIVIEYKNS